MIARLPFPHRVNKISLGGTRGKEYEARYQRAIEEKFNQVVGGIRASWRSAERSGRGPLDIGTATGDRCSWFRDVSRFRRSRRDLESMIVNVFDHLILKRTPTATRFGQLELAIETLYTLLKFKGGAGTSGFRDLLRAKWIQVGGAYFFLSSSLP